MSDYVSISILAMDPSMNNWGYSVLDYNPETKSLFAYETGTIKKSNTEFQYINEKDLNTAKTIYSQLYYLIEKYDIEFGITETPVGSQSASAMKSYGLCIGILGSLSLPLWNVRANDAKHFLTANPKASKEDVIHALKALYPHLYKELVFNLKGKLIRSASEHIADSMAAAIVAINDPNFDKFIRANRLFFEGEVFHDLPF